MKLNPLPNIQKYLAKRKELQLFKQSSAEDVFTLIYRSNKWGDRESVSGKGSSLEKTVNLRSQLPGLLTQLNAKVLLDIPCGDFHWMREIDLPVEIYIGADIVKPLIAYNTKAYGSDQRIFRHLDLTSDPLPDADVILCRECLVHLSFSDIAKALNNIKASGCRYLLLTHFPHHGGNVDITTGKHRLLNMTLHPFYWPLPRIELIEYTAGTRGDKCLSVWEIATLP